MFALVLSEGHITAHPNNSALARARKTRLTCRQQLHFSPLKHTERTHASHQLPLYYILFILPSSCCIVSWSGGSMRPYPGLPPLWALRFKLQLPASLRSRPDEDEDDEQCQLTTTHFLSTPAGLQIPPRDAAASLIIIQQRPSELRRHVKTQRTLTLQPAFTCFKTREIIKIVFFPTSYSTHTTTYTPICYN